MAVIKGNIFVRGARGRVGNLIYRIRYGIQELYAMPRKSKKKPSPAQKAQRLLMTMANGYAKRLKTNEQMRLFYEEMARKRGFTNAYHAAISHYLTSPKLLQVDFSDYLAKAGDRIVFKPTAWDKVESVEVVLKDAAGEVIESGLARNDGSGWWTYLVQTSHADVPAATVVFEIHDDLPRTRAREVAVPA
jgi:hypothetical protein